jgi:hypothetical protein
MASGFRLTGKLLLGHGISQAAWPCCTFVFVHAVPLFFLRGEPGRGQAIYKRDSRVDDRVEITRREIRFGIP